MGRCHEFGLQIHEGCGHPMEAGDDACSCPECGVVCGGRFAACPDVWARGLPPVDVSIDTEEAALTTAAPFSNGTGRHRRSVPAPVEASEASAPYADELGAEADLPPERPWSTPLEDDRAPVVPATPAMPHAAGAAALRWLEGAFAGLRDELQSLRGTLNQQQATMAELVSGITQQQAMLAELLEARQADFRLLEAAERLPEMVGDAVYRAADAGSERTVAAVGQALEGATERTVAAMGQALDGTTERTVSAVGQALDGTSERTVAALSEVMQTSQEEAATTLAHAFEGSLERASAHRDPATVAAQLRTFLETDQPAGSVVAAIATQAATQAMRAEVKRQLPAALEQTAAFSEARIDELARRMDKLVTRAMRAGARAAPEGVPLTRSGTAKRATAEREAGRTAPKERTATSKASPKKAHGSKAAPAEKAAGAGGQPARKAPAKKAPAKRSTGTRKAAAKRSTGTRKAAARKAPARKAPAKRSTGTRKAAETAETTSTRSSRATRVTRSSAP